MRKTDKSLGRRQFLGNGLVLAAGSLLPPLSLAQARRVERVGLQLYTLRNELSQDFEGTLAKVAELDVGGARRRVQGFLQLVCHDLPSATGGASCHCAARLSKVHEYGPGCTRVCPDAKR